MAEAPAKKAAAKAPAKKAAAKAPAKKAAAKAPATPNVPPETPNFTPDVEAAAERIKKTSERVLELSKENGLVWLEAYEKMLDGFSSLRRTRPKVSVPTGSKNLCQRKPTLFVTRYGRSSVH